MAFPLKAIGALAARIGFSLAQEAQKQVTVTLGFTNGAYAPATDSAPRVGGSTATVGAIEYKRKKGEGPTDQIAENRFAVETKTLLIKCADLAEDAVIDRNTEIIIAASRWWVLGAQRDPSGATWIVDIGI